MNKKEIENLRDKVRYHDRKYYVENMPEITDYEYDLLMKELEKLEKAYPHLITPDSPTQRVSGEPISGFTTIEHKAPMLSIENTYTEEELKEFDHRIRRMLKHEGKIEYVVELKIDGVAVTLWYEKGIFIRGATRGDGFRGDDVTSNLRTIKDIPLRFSCPDNRHIPSVIEIRGEIYLPDKEFQRLNEGREESGEPQFANPRNAAAGSLKLLDPCITAQRHLRLFTYAFGYYEDGSFSDHSECLETIKEFGLPVNPHYKLCANIDEVISYCNSWESRRNNLDYQVDGMVVKVNSLDLHNKLGSTSKAPRGVMSYKFQPEEAVTKIEDIRVQVGKSGTLTPVAELSPVQLSGSTVSKASLHNFDEIERKDIRIGDYIAVQKAGEIIPQVVRVILEKRDGNIKTFPLPKTCPACKGDVIKEEVYLKCYNPLCPAQSKRRIQYFVSRNAMDIEGFGPAVIDQLVDKEIIKDYGDIYLLKFDDLVSLERMAKKSAQNLLNAVEQSKSRDLHQLICALGIQQVGKRAAEVLANHFGSLDKLADASIEDLEEIHEIGNIMAKSIVEFFSDENTKEVINKLKTAGVNTKSIRKESKTTSNIAEKSFVVTGALNGYSRKEIEEIIKNLDGKVSSAVSSKTDFLVVGESPGSKLETARRLGTIILNKEEFEKLINLKH